MDNNKYVVKNRSTGRVVYNLKELGVRREFQAGEPKTLEKEEIEKLMYIPGGRELIENYLQIQDSNITADLGLSVEPEYNMSEADVIDLLKNGSQDAFLDALDFAPTGVLDLIKKFAVELPLNDNEKREALKKKLGFDTSAAIVNAQEEKEENESAAPERRVKKAEESEATQQVRRTSGDKYKIVNK